MSCYPLFSAHISRFVRDMCVCSVGPMIKNQARDLAEMFIAGIIADTPCCKVATSAGIWHRAQPQERPGVHEGGALASECPFQSVTPNDLAVAQHFKA